MRRKLDKFDYLIGMTIALGALGGLVALCWWLTPLLLYGVHFIWSITAFSLMAAMFALLIVLLRVLHEGYYEDS